MPDIPVTLTTFPFEKGDAIVAQLAELTPNQEPAVDEVLYARLDDGGLVDVTPELEVKRQPAEHTVQTIGQVE